MDDIPLDSDNIKLDEVGNDETRHLLSNESDDKPVNATELKETIIKYEQILKKPPLHSTISRDEKEQSSLPSIEGYLSVQAAKKSQVKTRYCSYVNTWFTIRKELNGKIVHRFQVSYCDMDTIFESVQQRSENAEDENFISVVNYGKDNLFKLFSNEQVYLCHSEEKNANVKDWVNTIREDLKQTFGEEAFGNKDLAFQKMNPLIRNLFDAQNKLLLGLISVLLKSGLMGADINPITSKHKQFSGILGLQIDEINSEFTDHYFVLYDNSLYFYKESRDRLPTGVILLQYATIDVDFTMIRNNENILRISTPICTYYLKAKHKVALNEWISQIDTSLKNSYDIAKGKNKKMDLNSYKSPINFLKKIEEHQLDSLEHLLAFSEGQEALNGFLMTNSEDNKEDMPISSSQKTDLRRALQFWIEAHEFKKIGDDDDRIEAFKHINNKFISLEGECPLSSDLFAPEERKSFVSQAPHPRIYEEIAKKTLNKIQTELFEKFKQSSFFENLKSYVNKDIAPNPHMLDPSKTKVLLFHNPKLKIKHYILPSVQNITSRSITIGRDPSNKLIIADALVSRAHGRLEYCDNGAEYTDVGSTYGSKLNDQEILRSYLQDGDILHLGNTDIEFTLMEIESVNQLPGESQCCIII